MHYLQIITTLILRSVVAIYRTLPYSFVVVCKDQSAPKHCMRASSQKSTGRKLRAKIFELARDFFPVMIFLS